VPHGWKIGEYSGSREFLVPPRILPNTRISPEKSDRFVPVIEIGADGPSGANGRTSEAQPLAEAGGLKHKLSDTRYPQASSILWSVGRMGWMRNGYAHPQAGVEEGGAAGVDGAGGKTWRGGREDLATWPGGRKGPAGEGGKKTGRGGSKDRGETGGRMGVDSTAIAG